MELQSDLENDYLNVLWGEECNLVLVGYFSLHMFCKQIFFLPYISKYLFSRKPTFFHSIALFIVDL